MKTIRFMPRPLAFCAGAALALGVSIAGCGGNSTTKPPAVFAPPTALTASNGNEQIVVHWTPSPDEGLSEFARYNIYRGTSSLVGIDAGQLEQLGNKVGSVGAGVDSFRTTVANGTVYYFHVRAQKDNGDLSEATNEVQAAGRQEGAGRILEEFAADGESGFDFSSGLAVSLRQDNPDRFALTDIYLGTGAANDTSTAALSLKSPALLVRLNSEWAGHEAGIKFLGTDWEENTTTDTGFVAQLDVLAGAVYAIRTPGGNYAKVKVDTISGTAGSRSITFRYSYQTTPSLIQF